MLGYRDSGMPDTDANSNPKNFANAELDEAEELDAPTLVDAEISVGLPATIEGAVRSGRRAAALALGAGR